jgi:mannose-1-phosphate guanylyltransferase
VLEPIGRNTAPAIAVAAMQALADGGDPLLLVLPSDHVVANVDAFRAAVREASVAAEAGALVTFGILPTAPETGFGYIEADGNARGVRPVKRFVEKPDLATAQAWLESGGYYWNSGMFLFRASRVLEDSRASVPTSSRRAGPPSTGPDATAISFAWTRQPSRPARRIPSTMRSWNAPTPRWSCRSTSDGTTWARGRRCGT